MHLKAHCSVLTNFVFPFFVFHSLQDMMYNSTSRSIIEESIFVVYYEATLEKKRTSQKHVIEHLRQIFSSISFCSKKSTVCKKFQGGLKTLD